MFHTIFLYVKCIFLVNTNQY